MRTIASWIYLLVRYTYIPIKMIKISNAVTILSEIKKIRVASTEYINYVICCYENINILGDVSSDEEEGCSTIIVDEQKHIMAHKSVLDIVHAVGI